MNAIQAWYGEKTLTYKYIIMMGPLMIKAIFFTKIYCNGIIVSYGFYGVKIFEREPFKEGGLQRVIKNYCRL